MAKKNFKAGLYSKASGGSGNGIPPQSSQKLHSTCPDNCSFININGGCLAHDGISFLCAGLILEGVSILTNLPEECKFGVGYLLHRLYDLDNKYPEETPMANFAMGLSYLAAGKDFKLCYEWIKEAADKGCSEAKELLKHLKP